MENFVKTSFELVNGNAVINSKLMARSLVLFNEKGTVYNIAAKVRNTDKFSVARALAKAVLASMREANKLNTTQAALESKKRVVNKVTPALSCSAIMITDKNGAILPNAVLSVTGQLRDIIRITKGMPLYKLVVENGLDWSNESVVKALNAWTTATIEQMDYVKNLDEALGKAAESTEKEEIAAEKEVKTTENEEKAAESTEKEEIAAEKEVKTTENEEKAAESTEKEEIAAEKEVKTTENEEKAAESTEKEEIAAEKEVKTTENEEKAAESTEKEEKAAA